MKRIMGLDVGSKTLGIALSDLLGMTAQGLETLAINESEEYYGLDRLEEIIQDYDVKAIVVGLPKNMDGSEGERAEKSRAYAKRLEDQFDLPIHLVDERLTTQQAERMLIEEGDVSRKKRQEIIDKLAAVLILQGYLDSMY